MIRDIITVINQSPEALQAEYVLPRSSQAEIFLGPRHTEAIQDSNYLQMISEDIHQAMDDAMEARTVLHSRQPAKTRYGMRRRCSRLALLRRQDAVRAGRISRNAGSLYKEL